jgi:hypothetical protein
MSLMSLHGLLSKEIDWMQIGLIDEDLRGMMSVVFHDTGIEAETRLTIVVDDVGQNVALLRPLDGEKAITTVNMRKFGWYHPTDDFPIHLDRWNSGHDFVKSVCGDEDLRELISSLALFGVDDTTSFTLQ